MDRIAYQPIHASMRARLDAEYVALHDAVLQYCVPVESSAMDPAAMRTAASPMAHGVQKAVNVGHVQDRVIRTDADGSTVDVRIFRPAGHNDTPAPLLVWLHGGGWVVGGLDSDNGFLTHLCKYLACVVVSVNYRHAPEHMYPAAIEDAFFGYEWATSPETVHELGIDPARAAIGGFSAGGGLAASISLMAADRGARTRPSFQLLVCPVVDNTATTATAWAASQNSPWLTPARMQWYRDAYFGTGAGAAAAAREWTASPTLAPAALLAQSPATFLALAGCDLLAPEDETFGARLAENGVPVEVQTYPGATHSVLVLAGIHKTGQTLVHDAAAALGRAFGVAYDAATAPVLGVQ